MLDEHIVHDCCTEHGSHRNIRLTDGRTCISCFHLVQNDLAMHRFDITQAHTSDDRLDVHSIPFPVISLGIGCQICNQMGDPELKPGIHRHFGGRIVNIVLILVLCIGKPVASFRERTKMLFLAGTVLCGISCGVLTVFSLADTLSTFSAF